MIASGKPRTFSTGSARDARAGKGRYDLISPLALKRLALRSEGGADHYGDRNWEKGQPLMSYLDSVLRHVFRHIEGDREEDHLSAAFWNIQAVIHTEEMIHRRLLPKELDDRPSYVSRAEQPILTLDLAEHTKPKDSGVCTHDKLVYSAARLGWFCKHCGERS